MSEERKDVSTELADEVVEEATGGYDMPEPVNRTVTCPNCQFTYSFMAQRIVEIPPDCPSCGHKWVLQPQQQTAF